MDLLQLQSKLSFLLEPLSFLYRWLLAWRRHNWESGYLNRMQISCPCVSIGNIAWGGTGKTPLTDWFLTWAKKKDIHTVVLSRGYKAQVSLASIYVKSHHIASEVGDEPLMLALDHPDAAILVDPDRRRSGRYAMTCLTPELMILDDGFQHLSVQRDLDIVLLRPEDLTTEWNHVLPAGSWREGSEALSRADVFLIRSDRAGMENLLPSIKERLAQFKRPVFSFFMRPVRLEPVGSWNNPPPDTLWSQPYALVTGVGNPASVRETVTQFLGHPPDEEIRFPDHHIYRFRDIESLSKKKVPLICTCKDAVKLRHFTPANLWAMRVTVDFGPALWTRQPFPQWFEEWLNRRIENRIEQMSEHRWTGFVPEIDNLWEPPPPPASQTTSGKPAENSKETNPEQKTEEKKAEQAQNIEQKTSETKQGENLDQAGKPAQTKEQTEKKEEKGKTEIPKANKAETPAPTTTGVVDVMNTSAPSDAVTSTSDVTSKTMSAVTSEILAAEFKGSPEKLRQSESSTKEQN